MTTQKVILVSKPLDILEEKAARLPAAETVYHCLRGGCQVVSAVGLALIANIWFAWVHNKRQLGESNADMMDELDGRAVTPLLS